MQKTFEHIFESLKLSNRTWSVSPRVVYWTAVAILIAYMFIPREYAYAQASEGVTYPYTKTFVITGYYSPLPGQSVYLTGSLEAEKRLNGNGTNGADGTEVYPGMVAAPKTFAFGTKMKIPGIGTVAVHDRGGAIVNNRLDIWFGSGEEGLARALAWGKRSVDVTVYGIDSSITEQVAIDLMPKANLERFRVAYASHTQVSSTPQKVFKDLAYGESGDEVRLMQEYLSLLGYFDESASGYYGESTVNAVKEFQLDTGVIKDTNEVGGGVFGPKTRDTFESQLEKNRVEDLENIPTETLFKGKTGDDVQKLNYFLSAFGYLQSSHAAITRFDNATEDALKRMQYDLNVINTEKDVGSGVYGKKTQTSLKQLVEQRWNPGKKFTIEEGATPLTFTQQLSPDQQSVSVQNVQRMLRDLHFLSIQPNGYYGRVTQHAVFKFQQAFGIVAAETDDGAGVVGPKTLAKLNELASQRNSEKKQIGLTTETNKLVASRLADEKNMIASAGIPKATFSEPVRYGQSGSNVEQLQVVLKQLGFFQGKVTTEYFGDQTKNSLVAFQKNHGLTESGELDEMTLNVLNRIVN